MKAKMKQSAKNERRDEQILLHSLENAIKQDSAAKGGVTVNEDDQISIVHFQSGQMSYLSNFLILLVDGRNVSMLLLLKKTRLICNELSNLSRFLILRGRMCM